MVNYWKYIIETHQTLWSYLRGTWLLAVELAKQDAPDNPERSFLWLLWDGLYRGVKQDYSIANMGKLK